MSLLRRLNTSNHVATTLATRPHHTMQRNTTTKGTTFTRLRTNIAHRTTTLHHYVNANFFNDPTNLFLLNYPLTLTRIRPLYHGNVTSLLLTRFILVFLLHLLIFMLLLYRLVLPRLLLRFLLPYHINPFNFVNTITYVSIMPNIRRTTYRTTRAHNTNGNRLNHVTRGTRRNRRVIRSLLTTNHLLLFLYHMMAMRTIRLTRVVLVTPMVLNMDHIMNVTLLFRLNMMVHRLPLVLLLDVLLLPIRLISLLRRNVTTTLMNVRHRPMRHKSNLTRHTSLLLVYLPNHANHMTKAVTTNRNDNLHHHINANILNVLNMRLNMLTMR